MAPAGATALAASIGQGEELAVKPILKRMIRRDSVGVGLEDCQVIVRGQRSGQDEENESKEKESHSPNNTTTPTHRNHFEI